MSKAKLISASVFAVAAAVGLSACGDDSVRGPFSNNAPKNTNAAPAKPLNSPVQVELKDAYCKVNIWDSVNRKATITIRDSQTNVVIVEGAQATSPFNLKTGTLDAHILEEKTQINNVILRANLKEGTCQYNRSGQYQDNRYLYKIPQP